MALGIWATLLAKLFNHLSVPVFKSLQIFYICV